MKSEEKKTCALMSYLMNLFVVRSSLTLYTDAMSPLATQSIGTGARAWKARTSA